MPRPVDTKTQQPWPEVWANRMLQVFRKKAITDLQARDRARGIQGNGQVYTVTVEGKGEHRTETRVVDLALAGVRHNYREVRKLFKARWFKFCSLPQDLDIFKGEFEKPDIAALKRAEDEAKAIEESLVADAQSIEDSLPAVVKRGPGRPKKAEPVEA